MNRLKKQKKYFDMKTKARRFSPGDKVLVLLLTDKNMLLVQLEGPYDIVNTVGLFSIIQTTLMWLNTESTSCAVCQTRIQYHLPCSLHSRKSFMEQTSQFSADLRKSVENPRMEENIFFSVDLRV